METTYFEVFLTLLSVSTLYLSNTFAQESYTQWSLPEGAKMRLGKGNANVIEYSPDGTFLAVASDIGIWLYDANNGEELKIFSEHTDSIYQISFSPDGKTLASVEGYSAICLWDVLTGEVKLKFPGYRLWTKDEYILNYRHEYGKDESIRDISFSPDGKTLAIVGSYAIYLTETVELLNLPDADSVTIDWMLIHTDDIVSTSFSPDGQTLASVDHRTIRLWDVLSGTVKQEFETSYDSNVLFSPDGQTLASVSSGKILLWDITTGTVKQELTRNDENRIESISFSPDGQTLASGNEYSICLWEVSAGTVKQVIGEGSFGFRCVSFSPDGKRLAGISRARMVSPIYVWDVSSGTLESSLDLHTQSISSVSFSPDGKVLLGKEAGLLGDNFLWDVSTGMVKLACYVPYVTFSPDGQTLAIGGCSLLRLLHVFRGLIRGISPCSGEAIGLLDVSGCKRARILIGHRKFIRSISFSPDNKTLVSAGFEGTIHLWDILKGKTKVKFRGYYSPLFSPDGKMLALQREGDIHLWDVSAKKVKQKLTGHEGSVENLLFSPDGKTVVGTDYAGRTNWDKIIHLWDVSTGKIRSILPPDPSQIQDISFSPDGKILASAEVNKIRLWDISTCTVLQELIGDVKCISFSPDGSMLASGGYRGQVVLWDVSTGTVVQAFTGHTDWIVSVTFSPMERQLQVEVGTAQYYCGMLQ